ncbi:MAG TPA: hypothetical protein VH120_21205 [Gemmataceae bacterium]|jgi:hypothetical protein|nr:hypothetical protein [Gemmataceae bacterium]
MLRPLTRRLPLFLAVFASFVLPLRASAQDVRVTVVTILASDKPGEVNPKLKDLAQEVRKVEPNLSAFRLGKTGHRNVTVGQKEAIKLFDNKDYSTDVTVLAKDDTKKRVTIEVKPPMAGAIAYETSYNKFFPIVTRAVVDGERLIIAYSVKPAEKTAPAPPGGR